ncbi:MAG: hypothetical protein GKR89_09860 [Candidatus Latescibacteria bacterium]|nr:hypothetical protein [Candidatus Latescibacterota bacterium]
MSLPLPLPLTRLVDWAKAPPDKPTTWFFYAVVIALLAGPYFDSALDLPLQSHDADTFSDNEAITRDFSYFFSADKLQMSGRPVAELFKWVVSLVGGNNPTWFHLCSVGLHFMSAWLLALWGRRTGASMGMALTAGVLFLVQVGHYQAIHHISALDYPLALVFGLGALLSWQAYLGGGQKGWLAGVYLLLTLGVMVHQAIAVAWGICLVWAWIRGDLKSQGWKLWPVGGVLVAVSIGLLLITPDSTHVRGSVDMYGSQDYWSLVGGMGRLLLWFLSRLLTTAHWLPLQIREQYAWEPFLGALVLVGLVGLLWKRIYPPALWAVWTVAALLPFVALTEQLVHSSAQTSGRYLYIASAGIALLMAWLLCMAAGRLRRGGGYLYVLVLAGLLLSSYRGLHDSEALTLYAAGRRFIGRGEIEPGLEALRRALERAPGALPADAFFRYGSQMLARGEDARGIFQEGLERFPQDLSLRVHLAVAEHERGAPGRMKELIGQVRQKGRERQIQAIAALVYHNLGVGYVRGEHTPQAVKAFAKALALQPQRANTKRALEQTHFFLSLYYLKKGEAKAARQACDQAVQRYGAQTGRQVGMVTLLRSFIDQDLQAQVARQMLEQYWPEN